MRKRSEDKRGGQDKPDDGFDRRGPTIAANVDRYLDWLRFHNRTPMAVNGRWAELKPFLAWSEERGLFDPEQITRSILESYQRYLWRYRKKNGKPLGTSTQRGRLGGVKRFFSWLTKQRIIEANPASELELPRFEKRLPMDTPSISEIETILAVPEINDALGIRDRAILELFYSTGMRRGELVGMQVADLDREKHIARVHGKGNKDRVVPVGTRALQWVEKYLDDVRPLLLINADEQALFLTGYGHGFNPDVLGRKVIRYIRDSGTGHIGGCHLFRHACATHMLEGGADIRYIQQLLGHENLETTSIYTRVSITQLRDVHARCHPAEHGKEDGIKPSI